jgi:hypothetical protein
LPTENAWFTATYNFNGTDVGGGVGSGYSYGKTLRLLEGILTDGKEDGVQILPPGTTTTTKVYFAIGLSRANAGKSNDQDGTVSPWEHGIVSLVKNVKLIYDTTNTEIAGVIPSFTAGGKTSTQVFIGYIDPRLNYQWSGAPGAAVTIKADPNYTPPAPVTPATEQLKIITSDAPLKNATALAGNYQAAHFVEIPYPAGLSLGSYSEYTIRAKFYEANGTTEIPVADGLGAARFVISNTDQTGIGGGQWNLGTAGTINHDIPQAAADAGTVTHILIFNTNEDVKFIEVTEVTLKP